MVLFENKFFITLRIGSRLVLNGVLSVTTERNFDDVRRT